MNPFAALASAALFAWQPLLWGHAFINPKDPPFLVFFLGAVCFGFEMIDAITQSDPKGLLVNKHNWTEKKPLGSIFLAALFLGIATSIRVLGPLAGILVGIYALGKFNKSTATILIKYFTAYFILTILITFLTWPYLWTSPLQKFIEVFGFMSDNPTQLPVLFNGQVYKADELPRRYLPILLGYTLTEPIWLLFIAGLVIGFWKSNNQQRIALALTLLWFIVPSAYVIFRKPPMYDGFRHFLFILPPVFIFAGFAFEKMFTVIKTTMGRNCAYARPTRTRHLRSPWTPPLRIRLLQLLHRRNKRSVPHIRNRILAHLLQGSRARIQRTECAALC